MDLLARLRRSASKEKSNRAARIIVDRIDATHGIGPEWWAQGFGRYYAASAAVHSAVRVRAEAVSRPPLAVFRRSAAGAEYAAAGPDDPLQALLDRPNPAMSRSELLRTTETNLLLWGSAYWGIERDGQGTVAELWPLRSDRMKVLPDPSHYVRGFIYEREGRVAYLPEEIVWFRHIDPLQEFGGQSSVMPARLAVDMAAEAMRYNHGFFRNSAMPADLVITAQNTQGKPEVDELYRVWDERFRGTDRAHRPAVLMAGLDIKRVGFSQKDMEFLETLRWAVDEVARSFGVPKVFLAEFADATLANVWAQERFLWRNTIVPELLFIEDVMTRSLAPHFESFPGEYRLRFDLRQVEALQEPENERAERLAKLVSAGILAPEEARAEIAQARP